MAELQITVVGDSLETLKYKANKKAEDFFAGIPFVIDELACKENHLPGQKYEGWTVAREIYVG